jgi:hypothetical protein
MVCRVTEQSLACVVLMDLVDLTPWARVLVRE